MQYERQLDKIWLRLQDPNAPRSRHIVSTREVFDDVCAAFLQAELGPEGDNHASSGPWGGDTEQKIDDIKTYRAEWNVWAYYYGEQDPFPGIDPALRTYHTHNLNSNTSPSRQRDTYFPSYSIEDTTREKKDIGAELRGRHASEKERADDQKDRALRAIEKRAEEAKKFMEYRRRKEKERKERKRRELLSVDSRDRDGHLDVEGRETRGSAYDTRYGEVERGWGYDTGHGRHQEPDRGWSHYGEQSSPKPVRSGYIDRESRRGERHAVWGEKDQYHAERRSDFSPQVQTSKQNYPGKTRRTHSIDNHHARYPLSLHREDAIRNLEPHDKYRSSQWIHGSQAEEYSSYQGVSKQKGRENDSQSRCDRGFGILRDEKDCYRQERKRYRTE
ncbi:hypothetical protein ONS95_012812 [Cadophora gregata]|uniref:uncharacterized protein n=1 Tax=Cadophora gregata TaxID=51156 RepID=UPI0026DB6381|nr:uncharacterized protein ONS95_012812 [Cadophora gregata]KAK0101207.1 hypothetical protein ONS96_006429 [Cadophora gregata f. sp. sojae]KAK0115758.1 hypothetical protein ONS95_012812 [Cadophora gregata]